MQSPPPTKGPRLPIYATCTLEEANEYAERTSKGHWDLFPYELIWRDRQPYLEEKGYLLRPRYRTEWCPSWLGTQRKPEFSEDSIWLKLHHVIDATRLHDGLRVSIKVVRSDTMEIAIARMLSSDDLLRNPSNHCVPVLDVLPDPIESSKSLLIMPYLRPFNNPEFGAVGEVVDFIKQSLEGLCFIHSQRVAHRDCAAGNIMMDARPLYPQGHHPVRLYYTPDAVYDAPGLSRIDHPVQYYFIDFGLSTCFPEGAPPYVTGTKGRDKDPPELSHDVPYNAFMLDVFLLGNVYNMEFLSKYDGLDFLEPLVSSMIQPQPERRPTAEEAFSIFQRIQSGLDGSLLRWRLRKRTESAPVRVVYDTVAVAREGIYQLKRLVG